MTDGLTLTSSTTVGPGELDEVADLVSAASARDAFSGLNEAALLHLRHARPGVTHVLARRQRDLAGYAQLDTGPPQDPAAATSTGQLVVHPRHRRSGVGSALLAELIRLSPSSLHLWAVRNTRAARALAASQHLVASRVLMIMTRSLSEPVSVTRTPTGTTIRTFVVGQDEDEWLRVNARAFRHHPEQGRLLRADLDDRMAEPWFDPAGFFVAIRDHTMTGFHWTKEHPDSLGEVYVLGVDPDAGSQGLGKALLSRGLSHLRDRGDAGVQLYVEADHRQAVRLYGSYGFTESSRDVMYAQP